MRYGLMSNQRRSWGKVGGRLRIPNQQEFANRYLFSAIDPIEGDNFHVMGWNNIDSRHSLAFLEELGARYPDYHLLIVWDRAPFHQPKFLHAIPEITLISLPSYSPELNPVERFFGEMRKVTANRIFADGIEQLERLLEKALISWIDNLDAMKSLSGYRWIIDQWNSLSSLGY